MRRGETSGPAPVVPPRRQRRWCLRVSARAVRVTRAVVRSIAPNARLRGAATQAWAAATLADGWNTELSHPTGAGSSGVALGPSRYAMSVVPAPQSIEVSLVPSTACRLSLPAAPDRVSAPSPPVRVSLPMSPFRVSLPPKPMNVLLSSDPEPAVWPVIVSLPSDPSTPSMSVALTLSVSAGNAFWKPSLATPSRVTVTPGGAGHPGHGGGDPALDCCER